MDDVDIDNIDTLKRTELQRLCKKFGLKATGKNTALVKVLKVHYASIATSPQKAPSRRSSPVKSPQHSSNFDAKLVAVTLSPRLASSQDVKKEKSPSPVAAKAVAATRRGGRRGRPARGKKTPPQSPVQAIAEQVVGGDDVGEEAMVERKAVERESPAPVPAPTRGRKKGRAATRGRKGSKSADSSSTTGSPAVVPSPPVNVVQSPEKRRHSDVGLTPAAKRSRPAPSRDASPAAKVIFTPSGEVQSVGQVLEKVAVQRPHSPTPLKNEQPPLQPQSQTSLKNEQPPPQPPSQEEALATPSPTRGRKCVAQASPRSTASSRGKQAAATRTSSVIIGRTSAMVCRKSSVGRQPVSSASGATNQPTSTRASRPTTPAAAASGKSSKRVTPATTTPTVSTSRKSSTANTRSRSSVGKPNPRTPAQPVKSTEKKKTKGSSGKKKKPLSGQKGRRASKETAASPPPPLLSTFSASSDVASLIAAPSSPRETRRATFTVSPPSSSGTSPLAGKSSPGMSVDELKASIMADLDKKVGALMPELEASSKLPRPITSSGLTASGKAVTSKDWSQIHNKAFSRMKSIDQTHRERQARLEKMSGSHKPAASSSVTGTKEKPKNVPVFQPPDGKKKLTFAFGGKPPTASKPAVTTTTAAKKSVATTITTKTNAVAKASAVTARSTVASRTPAAAAKPLVNTAAPKQQPPPPMAGKVSISSSCVSMCPGKTPVKTDDRRKSVAATPGTAKRFSFGSPGLKSPSVPRARFDINASLKRPLSYKPYTGPLNKSGTGAGLASGIKPPTARTTAPLSVKSPNVRIHKPTSPKKDFKQPSVRDYRTENRLKMQQRTKDRRGQAAMSNRGL